MRLGEDELAVMLLDRVAQPVRREGHVHGRRAQPLSQVGVRPRERRPVRDTTWHVGLQRAGRTPHSYACYHWEAASNTGSRAPVKITGRLPSTWLGL